MRQTRAREYVSVCIGRWTGYCDRGRRRRRRRRWRRHPSVISTACKAEVGLFLLFIAWLFLIDLCPLIDLIDWLSQLVVKVVCLTHSKKNISSDHRTSIFLFILMLHSSSRYIDLLVNWTRLHRLFFSLSLLVGLQASNRELLKTMLTKQRPTLLTFDDEEEFNQARAYFSSKSIPIKQAGSNPFR